MRLFVNNYDMSEIPSNREKPEDIKQGSVTESHITKDGVKREEGESEIVNKFKEAMKIETYKETETEKMKKDLMEKYKDLPEEKIDEVIQSKRTQDTLENEAKLLLEWQEKRKTLYLGVFDLKPIKDLFKKIKSKFFEK